MRHRKKAFFGSPIFESLIKELKVHFSAEPCSNRLLELHKLFILNEIWLLNIFSLIYNVDAKIGTGKVVFI